MHLPVVSAGGRCHLNFDAAALETHHRRASPLPGSSRRCWHQRRSSTGQLGSSVRRVRGDVQSSGRNKTLLRDEPVAVSSFSAGRTSVGSGSCAGRGAFDAGSQLIVVISALWLRAQFPDFRSVFVGDRLCIFWDFSIRVLCVISCTS